MEKEPQMYKDFDIEKIRAKEDKRLKKLYENQDNPGTFIGDLSGAVELHKAVSEYNEIKNYEKRVVDKETGGEKCKKMTRFSLIPPRFLWELADHFEVGAMKSYAGFDLT